MPEKNSCSHQFVECLMIEDRLSVVELGVEQRAFGCVRNYNWDNLDHRQKELRQLNQQRIRT